jgi:hypothetical protein
MGEATRWSLAGHSDRIGTAAIPLVDNVELKAHRYRESGDPHLRMRCGGESDRATTRNRDVCTKSVVLHAVASSHATVNESAVLAHSRVRRRPAAEAVAVAVAMAAAPCCACVRVRFYLYIQYSHLRPLDWLRPQIPALLHHLSFLLGSHQILRRHYRRPTASVASNRSTPFVHFSASRTVVESYILVPTLRTGRVYAMQLCAQAACSLARSSLA